MELRCLDPDGEIRILINNLYPDTTTPYRVVESFVNAGLAAIGARMEDEPGIDIGDFFPVAETLKGSVPKP